MRLLAVGLLLMTSTGVAWAEEDPGGTSTLPPRSHFTVAFAGGGILPSGRMKTTTSSGLDVWSRIGWNAANGLGLVMNLEYAPLRHSAPDGLTAPDLQIDGQLFTATAAPRLTLGHHALRLWVSAGGGILIERVSTQSALQPLQTQVDSAFTLTGAGGLDLHLFGSGGLTVAGGYTHSLSDSASYDYFSLNAGLVFTI